MRPTVSDSVGSVFRYTGSYWWRKPIDNFRFNVRTFGPVPISAPPHSGTSYRRGGTAQFNTSVQIGLSLFAT